MKFKLEWHDATKIRIAAQDVNEFLWDEARRFFPNHEPMGEHAISVSYYEFLAAWRNFWGHFSLSSYGIAWDIDDKLKADVRAFISHQNVTRNFSPEELKGRLRDAGFVRELKDFQTENVCRLAQKNQGATFSVPGAGKTTEALAFFFATAAAADRLLVVAPLNAFGAWDEQLSECTGNPNLSFVRLSGGAESVRRLLLEEHRFMLTNYELLRSSLPKQCIHQYLNAHRDNTYVFLDESHKIKNGRTAQTEAIREIQGIPKARLIMSGTPMPQGPKDLLTQYSFLFPDVAVSESDVVDRFKGVYVRTTATRLGIPETREYECRIELDDVERELYRKMRRMSLSDASRLTPTNDARYLRSLGKCIMRLMAFVSNPALVADRFAAVMPELPSYLRHKDSPKISYVCKRARELAAQNKKVLIWSSFVRNVELISSRLEDIGADFIHGGVKAGDVNDPSTREGKIRRFHESGNRHMVLVANPAAASEGISLHKACQYAIYLDRTFNAAHYLQSRDRIHRLGLPPGTVPEIELVTCPNTIDELVNDRLKQKITTMAQALDDPSIIPSDPEMLYEDEEEETAGVDSTNAGISQSDVESILAHLRAI